jgi:predicted alpha/beta-fold hydrolase
MSNQVTFPVITPGAMSDSERPLARKATAAFDGFRPPRWLRDPHLQTLLNGSALRRPWLRRWVRPMLACAVDHDLDCGAGVRLHGQLSQQPVTGKRDLVVLLHGWEGSSRETGI